MPPVTHWDKYNYIYFIQWLQYIENSFWKLPDSLYLDNLIFFKCFKPEEGRQAIDSNKSHLPRSIFYFQNMIPINRK